MHPIRAVVIGTVVATIGIATATANPTVAADSRLRMEDRPGAG
jgi:hypothetical protein